jgi:hypothetical protein
MEKRSKANQKILHNKFADGKYKVKRDNKQK